MANNKAFVKNITTNGTSKDGENGSVQQTSPEWVLTFVRWENRDTKGMSSGTSTDVRDPLVVENDCLQVSTNDSKNTLTPAMNAVLIMSDVNYGTEIAPGDFVFVNMLNWPADARRVANQARAKKPINGVKDGFKGFYKVQSVRKILTSDPGTGTKILLFKITGYAFTEFNNTIYFNPYLIDPNQDPKNQFLFSSYLGRDWSKLINDKGLVNCQDLISVLLHSFIGDGINEQGRKEKNGVLKSPNVHFFMPSLVGNLLDIPGVKAAKDVYLGLFGIQQYSNNNNQQLYVGMNPNPIYSKYNRIYYTKTPCSGDSFLKPEYWNQVQAWSILNQYTNSPLNELYTCFRISPANKILPTLVYRQIPFTTEDFSESKLPTTKFLNLPRWKIHPSLIHNLDIGRDESARINFVQYFGKSTIDSKGTAISAEIAKGNYVYDVVDVQRSGLRPYIVTTQFDELTSAKKDYLSPSWAKIVGDALIGGHLKLNGTLECTGIVDPIAVGDNLEFDNVVFHIEQISHSCIYSVSDGKKRFRTIINLSSGVDINSSASGTKYSEMTNTRAYKERERDSKNNHILPGVSEEQDVVYRNNTTAPTKNEIEQNNKPFPQPKKGRT
jgi:hypothetical protein